MPILTNTTGYGLRPIKMVGGAAYTGAFETVRLGSVATGSALARGNLVRITGAGVLSANAGTGATAGTGSILGVVEGVEYTDSKGEYTIGTYLPAGVTSVTAGYTGAAVRVITDPNVVYAVMANDTVLKAVVNASGASIGIGAKVSLDGATQATPANIYAQATGKATATGTAGTIALIAVGFDEGLVAEAKNAAIFADANWVGDVHVRIAPSVHVATATTGI